MTNATSGIVPLRRSAFVHVDIDDSLAHDESRWPDFRRELLKNLRGVVETAGHDLNEKCVRFFGDAESDRPLSRKFGAKWMPPAGSECEIVGGYHDGQIVHGRDETDGYPPTMLYMPAASSTSIRDFSAPAVEPTPLFADPHRYRLIGFRNDSVRWVYELA